MECNHGVQRFLCHLFSQHGLHGPQDFLIGLLSENAEDDRQDITIRPPLRCQFGKTTFRVTVRLVSDMLVKFNDRLNSSKVRQTPVRISQQSEFRQPLPGLAPQGCLRIWPNNQRIFLLHF
jgi:hypothetical protein